MSLASLSLLCIFIFSAAPAGMSEPLVTDPGDQTEPDIYGRYVVYRDFQFPGPLGFAVIAYDLSAGSKTILNPTRSADNRPAVGESRAIWSDRRWDGGFGIVSTVIGSGVEDVILRGGGSAWGLDVNDRWAMWYYDINGEKGIRAYNFLTSQFSILEPTRDLTGYYDPSAHLSHSSDSVLLQTRGGDYLAIDLAAGLASASTAEQYDVSRRSYYNGSRVWEERNSDTGLDIYVSHAPEPSGLIALVSALAALSPKILRRIRP
ncbi:MAG: hypothetical protein Q7T82_21550 [Armatimonadota bacterium]|nr:hypothetical protein [Armatimonadota bacterium]